MKRNEVIEVNIEDHSFPATGIGMVDGKKVQVKGAFPGEVVECRANQVRSDRAKGKFMSLVKSAPYAVVAPCIHYGKCGGCISQHIPLPIQRNFKEEEVLKLEQKEIEMIKRSLEKNKGKRKAAADELGISERTLYRKIKQFDL